ncbi:MAG TPA: hypothetical protein VGS79_14965 [Puia sp.]|nr:hypothetical protein [Puia sp.]
MPFTPNRRRAWALLAIVLFHLSSPTICHGRMTSPAKPDTVIQGNREWRKFYKRIARTEHGLKDSIRKDILTMVLKNLDSLQHSIQKYAIRHASAPPGGTTYDIIHDVIIFNIQRNNTANFIHETTHGGQYQKGEIVYRSYRDRRLPDTCGGVGDDFDDEIAAYKAQFAFDPNSVYDLPNKLDKHPQRLTEIDKPWLINVEDTNQHPPVLIYLPNDTAGVTASHVNIYSTRRDMIDAYPKADSTQYRENYTLGNDPRYMNYPAKLRRYRNTHLGFQYPDHRTPENWPLGFTAALLHPPELNCLPTTLFLFYVLQNDGADHRAVTHPDLPLLLPTRNSSHRRPNR